MSNTLSRLKTAIAERYTVESEIGAGGMAIVYLAHDLRHDRKVAVKVLRPDIAATLGADRFLREVRIAANLTHPHILGLHDSGEADGFLFYVMPYIEGESLRDRVSREGDLPVHEAVRFIKEIVDALGYAHAHNVVHRDIKPDNVLVSGRHAMVTDFGVAKAVSEATGRDKLTTAGVALGTPSYMAPEQASAEPHIDHRADIYAVGVVAYELLTGQVPFTGHTQQQVLAAHLTEQPRPPSDLRPSLSPLVDQFVLKCLEKRPSDRWQSAEEMLPVLEALSTPSGGMTPTSGTAPIAPRARPAGSSVRVAVATGVVAAVAILGFLGWSSLRRRAPVVAIANIRQVTRANVLEQDPVISPDGGEVAYMAGGEIFVQDLEGGRPISLSGGPASLRLPRWTSDGRSVAFTEMTPEGDGQRAVLVPRFGGTGRGIGGGTLWDIRDGHTLWTRRDSLVLETLDAQTAPTLVVETTGPYSAALSPNGRTVAYVTGNQDYALMSIPGNIAPSTIWTVPVGGGEPVAVTTRQSLNASPAWLPDGRHLLFVSNRDGPRDLYVVRVDGSGRPRGEPLRVSTGLEPYSVSVSADGTKAVYSRIQIRRNVWRFPLGASRPLSVRDGQPLTAGNQIVESHALSPDGRWLAFDANLEGNQDIYVVPAEGGELRRLTTDPADDFSPSFSPDGRRIAFHSTRHGTRDILTIDVDGGNLRRLTDHPEQEYHPAYSPDGRHLAYSSAERGGRWIYVMSRDGAAGDWSAPRRLSRGPDTFHARWSPDGHHIVAHTSSAIVTLDLEGNEKIVVSQEGSGLLRAAWAEYSRDGRTIYFLGNDAGGSGLFAVPASGGPPRLVIRYDDPGKPVWLKATIGNGVAYLSVGEFESDVYAMDLEIH